MSKDIAVNGSSSPSCEQASIKPMLGGMMRVQVNNDYRFCIWPGIDENSFCSLRVLDHWHAIFICEYAGP